MILCRDELLVNNQFLRQFPLIGHSVFALQFKDLDGTTLLCKMDLLWPSMFCLRFGMQL